MGYNNVYRQLAGEILGETDKAIRFEFCVDTEDDYDPENPVFKSAWFPFSQISSVHRFAKPDNDLNDIIMVSEWILKQKGILHLAGITTPPALVHPAVPTASALSDKLKTPPSPNFSDMDDDIPF